MKGMDGLMNDPVIIFYVMSVVNLVRGHSARTRINGADGYLLALFSIPSVFYDNTLSGFQP